MISVNLNTDPRNKLQIELKIVLFSNLEYLDTIALTTSHCSVLFLLLYHIKIRFL